MISARGSFANEDRLVERSGSFRLMSFAFDNNADNSLKQPDTSDMRF